MPNEVLRKEVGLVFQTPVVFPMSIYKNMSYALSYHGISSKKELDRLIEEKLKFAGLYEEVKDKLKKRYTNYQKRGIYKCKI